MKKILLGIALVAIVCFSFGALAQDTKAKTKTETTKTETSKTMTLKTPASCCATSCEQSCPMSCCNAASEKKDCCQTEKVILTKKVEAKTKK